MKELRLGMCRGRRVQLTVKCDIYSMYADSLRKYTLFVLDQLSNTLESSAHLRYIIVVDLSIKYTRCLQS